MEFFYGKIEQGDSMKEILSYGNQIFAQGLVLFIVYTVFVVIVAYVVRKLLTKYLVKTLEKKDSKGKTTTNFYINILKTFIYGIAVFIILSDVKPLSSLGKAILGASSLLAVIVGLAAQETLGNFIAGFMLSIYQPFRVGDLIVLKEKDVTGFITSIGFRDTRIRTFDNTLVIVPNSVMSSTIIENIEASSKRFRNSVYFSISYDSDIDLAERLIKEQCSLLPQIIDARDHAEKARKEEIVKVFCTGLKDYFVELRVIFFTKSMREGFETSSVLRKKVKKAFEEHGVKIPFPTRVTYNKE